MLQRSSTSSGPARRLGRHHMPPAHHHARRPPRALAARVLCAKVKSRPSTPRSGGGGSSNSNSGGGKKQPVYAKDADKGFGERDPRPAAEPWEKDVLPPYRAYYKAGYRPPRFLDRGVGVGKNAGGLGC